MLLFIGACSVHVHDRLAEQSLKKRHKTGSQELVIPDRNDVALQWQSRQGSAHLKQRSSLCAG
jgi:hypothetical protein